MEIGLIVIYTNTCMISSVSDSYGSKGSLHTTFHSMLLPAFKLFLIQCKVMWNFFVTLKCWTWHLFSSILCICWWRFRRSWWIPSITSSQFNIFEVRGTLIASEPGYPTREDMHKIDNKGRKLDAHLRILALPLLYIKWYYYCCVQRHVSG